MKTKNIIVEGIPCTVEYKKIKNMHLYVRPPEGHVHITCPTRTPDKAIESFVYTNLALVKKHIAKVKASVKPERKYESGEHVRVFGDDYTLVVLYSSRKKYEIDEAAATLTIYVSPDSTPDERADYLKKVYGILLRAKVDEALPLFEAKMGLHSSAVTIRWMTSRWGSCTKSSGAIRLSSCLAQYELICLYSVIVHELCHLKYPNHQSEFYKLNDTYISYRREADKLLKEKSPLYL